MFKVNNRSIEKMLMSGLRVQLTSGYSNLIVRKAEYVNSIAYNVTISTPNYSITQGYNYPDEAMKVVKGWMVGLDDLELSVF